MKKSYEKVVVEPYDYLNFPDFHGIMTQNYYGYIVLRHNFFPCNETLTD